MNNGHGGVVVGSEMSGGVENLFVKNCTFNNMETGIRIKSMPGRGGYVRNLWFEDIDMNNIELDAVKISMNYKSSSIEPYNDKPPFFNNISLKNITCIDAGYGITVKGLPDNKVKGLFFDNFHIHSTNGSY